MSRVGNYCVISYANRFIFNDIVLLIIMMLKEFFLLYSPSKDKLGKLLYKGRYCIIFLHLHYTIKSHVVTTCNSWGFRAILND